MCAFFFRANWKMFQSTIKKRSSENLIITFSNLQSLNDTHKMYNIKKLNWWLRTVGDAVGKHMVTDGRSRWPQGLSSVRLTGGLSSFQSGSSLGGTTHQGQWSVQHFPISSKSNREESHLHTDLCHLGPTGQREFGISSPKLKKKTTREKRLPMN